MALESIKRGAQGEATADWQYFLLGQGLYKAEVNGTFDGATHRATEAFQKKHRLVPADGWVGRDTYTKAMQLGFDPVVYTLADKTSGALYPPLPPFAPLTSEEKHRLFSRVEFKASPTPSDPEAVTITNGWGKNIERVAIPQLVGVPGTYKKKSFDFHKLAGKQVRELFQAWEDAGLMHLVLGYGGDWCPRYVRGSRTTLSSHAWGTAFDINVAWNARGVVPAARGTKGSVRELVEIAYEYGFYWGGYFPKADGMHFELAVIL